MADNHFDLVMVYDRLGTAVRIKPYGTAAVLDPATDAPVTVVQDGQSVTVVKGDADGRLSFIAQQGYVKLVDGGLVQMLVSAEAATSGATNAAQAQAAQQAAETSATAAASSATDSANSATAASNSASSAASAATDAANTAVQPLSDQLGQLMGTAATIDDLMQSHSVDYVNGATVRSGDGWLSIGSSFARPIWTTTVPATIMSMDAVWAGNTAIGVAGNYITFTISRVKPDGTEATIVSKTTMDEDIAPWRVWSFAGATWDTAAAVLGVGDILKLSVTVTAGGNPLALPFVLTWRYKPS